MASKLIYDTDKEYFDSNFTKEKILKSLEEQGSFTLTHRIVQKGNPEYVSIKAMPMCKDHEQR